MPLGSKYSGEILLFDDWSEFKKYLDGTLDSRAFNYVVQGTAPADQFYRISTDPVAGTVLEITLPKATPTPGSSDQEDFEDNFAALAATRVPSLQVNVPTLPLPADAATETTQATLATEATAATLLTESDFDTRVGEVSASPTANTLLARLKAVNDTLVAEDFASETTLAAIKNTDGIKKITDALPTGSNTIGGVTQSGTWTVQPGNIANTTPWLVTGTGGTFPVTDNGGSLTIDSPQFPASLVGGRFDGNIGSWLGSTAPTVGQKAMAASVPVAIASNQAQFPVSQGTKAALADAWPVVPTDASGNAYSTQLDAGVRRLEVAGKVSVIGATPPPSTNDATIYADNPLSVGSHDTSFVIPNGETFYLQELVAGNENPTRGAQVEVVYDNGTEHVVSRIYIAGTTLTVGYPNRNTARDGTLMVGNGSHTIIVRRQKSFGTNIEIDAVVRGYTA